MGRWKRKLRDWFLSFYSDRSIVEAQFKQVYGRLPDLVNPLTFDEKIQWYKLYYRRSIMTDLADKYKVRQYVTEKGLGHILNELYGVYAHFEDIPFDALPEAFVMKANHGSGWNIICKSKAKLDMKNARAKLNRWLCKNHYLSGREWAYKHIEPMIICERYLENEEFGELIDYKFYCYGGVPEVIFVCCGRFGPEGVRYDAYDMSWNRIPACKGKPVAGLNLPKPPNFEAMRDIAITLSEGFPFIRVDLYSVQGRIYFSELTFYPDNGLVPFSPDHYNRFFGDFFKLPGNDRVQSVAGAAQEPAPLAPGTGKETT